VTSTDVVADHRAAGRAFTAAGMTGFVREAGDGRTVLCVHGVPASSFLTGRRGAPPTRSPSQERVVTDSKRLLGDERPDTPIARADLASS